MLISVAHAQEAAAAAGAMEPTALQQLIPFALIIVVFYFLMIRPQQKRLKDHRNMIAAVEKGDEVITGGGLWGKVTKVEDAVAHVEVADGVVVKVARDTLANVMKKEAKKTSGKNKGAVANKKVANDN